MPLNYRNIGENLAKRRKELKLRQYEVCERARSIPSLEVFIKLCIALETTPEHILAGSILETEHSASDEHLLEMFRSLSLDDQQLCFSFIELLQNRSK